MTNHDSKHHCLKCRAKLKEKIEKDRTIYKCNECDERIIGYKGIEKHHEDTDHHEYNLPGTKFRLGLL